MARNWVQPRIACLWRPLLLGAVVMCVTLSLDVAEAKRTKSTSGKKSSESDKASAYAVPEEAQRTVDLPGETHVIMTIDTAHELVVHPVCVYYRKAVYPPDALAEQVRGTATIGADLDKAGDLSNIRLVKSAGDPRLDSASLGAARQFQFLPAVGKKWDTNSVVNWLVRFRENSPDVIDQPEDSLRKSDSSTYESAEIVEFDWPELSATNITYNNWIYMRVHIDSTGKVTSAKVVRSSGLKAADDAAVASAWRCQFKPARKNNVPVDVYYLYMIYCDLR